MPAISSNNLFSGGIFCMESALHCLGCDLVHICGVLASGRYKVLLLDYMSQSCAVTIHIVCRTLSSYKHARNVEWSSVEHLHSHHHDPLSVRHYHLLLSTQLRARINSKVVFYYIVSLDQEPSKKVITAVFMLYSLLLEKHSYSATIKSVQSPFVVHI